MNELLNKLYNLNNFISEAVWGAPLILLIFFTGIYFTVRSGFFQIKHVKLITKSTFLSLFKKDTTKSHDKASVSQFQALSTALAATIGTGNIAGVATAITFGGPGAVFWMWISAVFGMMTSFAENTLGIYYRRKNEKNEWYGGAMYYINDGLNEKFHCKILNKLLAGLFCIFCIIASFGVGNMTQSNSIADACQTSFGIPTIISGSIIMIICGFVIIGGTNRICKVTEKLVPFMAICYILLTVTVFIANLKHFPYVFSSIIKCAFSFSAIRGGISGSIVKRAVSTGIKRGISSNEAGMGSSVTINASSDVTEPVIQGMWGIFQVFIDTIVICTLTAFCLLCVNNNAQSEDKILNNITTENQVFALTDSPPLISDKPNNISIKTDKNGNCILLEEKPELKNYLTVKIYDKYYYIETLPESSQMTFSNIMSVRANPVKNTNGKIVFDENKNPIVNSLTFSKIDGVSLVCYSLSQQFGSFAGKLLAVIIVLFAFSTIVGWSFYGVRAFEYLFGSKAVIVYKIIFTCFILVGSLANLSLVWSISDNMNAFMAIPNIIAVLALSGTVIKILNNYLLRKKHKNIKPLINFYENLYK